MPAKSSARRQPACLPATPPSSFVTVVTFLAGDQITLPNARQWSNLQATAPAPRSDLRYRRSHHRALRSYDCLRLTRWKSDLARPPANPLTFPPLLVAVDSTVCRSFASASPEGVIARRTSSPAFGCRRVYRPPNCLRHETSQSVKVTSRTHKTHPPQ